MHDKEYSNLKSHMKQDGCNIFGIMKQYVSSRLSPQ